MTPTTPPTLWPFHDTYYSSNIMACCILGKESLDELEKLAMGLNFGDIQNKNFKPKTWEEHCYGPEELGWRVDVVPVKDIRQLHLVFAVDDYKSFYKFQPGHYVSHLIGHEGKGSLLSELKRRGWATGLSTGPRTVARGIGFFDVQVELSEEGLKHAEDVIELIFHEIGTVKSAGAQKWIQDEIAGLGEIRFRFKDKETPLSYVTSLSGALQDVPFEDVLSHNSLVEKYDPELIERLIGQLTPQNMNYYVITKKTADLENLTSEEHYGTQYKKTKLNDGLIKKWEKAMVTPFESMFLPEKNEYIPSKFDLRPREEVKVEQPRLVRDDKIARVWYLQDDEFKLPKAQVHISMTLPTMASDPLNTLLSALYVMCFEDAISEEIYNPLLAGMKETVDITMKGLRLNFAGYDEKLHVFVADLVRKLVSYKADEKRFHLMMDRLIRNLKNFEQGQPYAQSQYYLNLLLAEKGWTKAQLLAVSEIVNMEMVNDFIPQIWKALHLELFAHGNLSEDEAKSLTDELLDVINESNSFVRPLFSNEMELIREMKIAEGTSHIYEHDQGTHANSCVDLVLQTGVQETRNNMLLELLVQIAQEPAYNVLRTTEQLGYIVHTGARRSNGAQSLEIIVQGSYDPKYMEERIEAFLTSFRETIEVMKDEDYQRNVNALANRRLEKPKTLRALSNRYWREIEARLYSFNRSDVEVQDLRKITKEELLKFYDEKIMAGSDKRQKLSIRVRSTVKGEVPEENGKVASEKQDGIVVKDIERFKALLSIYPWPKPAVELPSAGADSLSTTFKEQERK
uniref:Insulin-degrading enzyme n=1 Tax=Steinernema glaseri TaxID=37863 RepID=A0A1I7ZZB9_9BILA